MNYNRRTKIVATIGPATQDEASLEKMIQAGVNVARLNFSHGTHKVHQVTYNRLREISQRMEKPVAIMQDLQGVKIRTGESRLLQTRTRLIFKSSWISPTSRIIYPKGNGSCWTMEIWSWSWNKSLAERSSVRLWLAAR